MKRYLLAILASLGVVALQAADTVYVKAGSTPEAPYDTAENAFATLADAVSYAATEPSVKKIHIVGTQTLTAKVTLAGIEVFGDSRTATTITGPVRSSHWSRWGTTSFCMISRSPIRIVWGLPGPCSI